MLNDTSNPNISISMGKGIHGTDGCDISKGLRVRKLLYCCFRYVIRMLLVLWSHFLSAKIDAYKRKVTHPEAGISVYRPNFGRWPMGGGQGGYSIMESVYFMHRI
jgi:hypothetical protein